MDRRSFLIDGSYGLAYAYLLSSGKMKVPHVPFMTTGNENVQINPTWLRHFDEKNAGKVLWSPTFAAIVTSSFNGLTAPFLNNNSVLDTVREYMSSPGPINVENHRYFTAEGCFRHYGRSRAMLWIDTHIDTQRSTPPPAALAVIDVAQEGRFLWIIANDSLMQTSSKLPFNLRRNIRSWIKSSPPKRWEGGLLQYFTIRAQSPITRSPTPLEFGVPSYRCDPLIKVASTT